jgi:hypothetical protein
LARKLAFYNAANRRTLSNAKFQRGCDDQNGFTTAKMTMPIISSVGTSFITR